MRCFVQEDFNVLALMLNKKGIEPDEMGFSEERAQTFVMDEDGEIKGFFTLRKEHGLPYVVHFVSDKGYGLKLGSELKKALKATGSPRALISIPDGDKRLFNGVRRMLHGKLYDAKDGHYFFYMEINHVKI